MRIVRAIFDDARRMKLSWRFVRLRLPWGTDRSDAGMTVCPPHDQAARLWIMVTRGSTRSLGSCRERRVKVVVKRGSEQGEQEICGGPGSDGSSRRWRVAAPGCQPQGTWDAALARGLVR